MKLTIFKSKLHQMRVTEANLMYEGSITIDEELLEAAGILPYEKVQVVNITNGSRLETYTIPGERGSRVCCMNGAAARLTQVGPVVTVHRMQIAAFFALLGAARENRGVTVHGLRIRSHRSHLPRPHCGEPVGRPGHRG
jgi:L-aspartate-alpha-decarboxylase